MEIWKWKFSAAGENFWKSGSGNLEIWKWKSGNGSENLEVEVEIWKWKWNQEMEIWKWKWKSGSGSGNLEVEVESGSGNLEVEVEGNLEDLRTNSGKWKTLGAYMGWPQPGADVRGEEGTRGRGAGAARDHRLSYVGHIEWWHPPSLFKSLVGKL